MCTWRVLNIRSQISGITDEINEHVVLLLHFQMVVEEMTGQDKVC